MPELCAYWFTPGDALDFCRYANEAIVRMCEKAPGRFIGLGIVPLQDPDLAAKELARIQALGFPGIELGSNVDGKSLGMPEFQSFFQEAERLGVAIFVHALRPTMMDRFPTKNPFNPVGYPTDTCLTIASMIDGGTAEKCPNLRIAFSHGGGTFPFLLPRYNHQWSGPGTRRHRVLSPAAVVRPRACAAGRSSRRWATRCSASSTSTRSPASSTRRRPPGSTS